MLNNNYFLNIKLFIILLFIFCKNTIAYSQIEITRDSISKIIKTQPSFSIYKDNYCITGIPTQEEPTNHNSDIKIQISFKQRLTNSIMPFKSILYLTYTQKSFWKVYEKSSPFNETIFNPGLGLGKLIFKNSTQIGVAGLQLEHESNGQDSSTSRSWNCVSFSYMAFLSQKITIIGKAWIPFGLSDNKDLMNYIGYGEFTFNWEIVKNKFQVNSIIRKGAQFDLKGSIQANIYYNPLKNMNQYFFLQFFHGYAEDLSLYNKFSSMLRLGICIRPYYKLFNH